MAHSWFILNYDELIKIESMLNLTINELLFGGSTDPGASELEAAANIYKTLKLMELEIKYEEDIRRTLEKGNIYNKNWIEGF